MTNKKLLKQHIENFLKVHGSAVASIVCANLDNAEFQRAVEIIEDERIEAGDLRAYQKVVDAIVAHRNPPQPAAECVLEASEQRALERRGRTSQCDKGLFPPAGAVRQLDPKVAGIPWWEGGKLMIRIVDPKTLVERFNLEQRETGGDAVKLSHLLPLKLGKPRILKRSTQYQLESLKRIKNDFPHFNAVTDRIYSALHARMLAGSAACFKPILLVGGAGLGKTAYLNRVAEILQLEFHELSTTANDQISLVGLKPPWRGAQPGTLASIFKLGDSEEGTGNKLIFLDELDKSSTMATSSESSSNAGVFEQLLSAIEPGTASFIDSYLGQDLKLDLCYCSWVFAANDISRIPDYFLSRVERFVIDMPSPRQYRDGLLNSLYEGVLKSVPYAVFFVTQLSNDVADLLAESGRTPREIRQLIEASLEKRMSAFSTPPELGSIWIMPEDIVLREKPKRQKSIGFVIDQVCVR